MILLKKNFQAKGEDYGQLALLLNTLCPKLLNSQIECYLKVPNIEIGLSI